MILSKRLELISKKVEPCHTIVDIGTDHAYIPVEMIQRGVCQKAIASDVNQGPLTFAKKTIQNLGYNDKIEIRQGDGLQVIDTNEVECIVIAGMGGEMISSILQQGMKQAMSVKQLVLQAMSSVEVLRSWLFSNGFDIYDEELVRDGYKIYNVILARYDGFVRDIPSLYQEVSKWWVIKKDPLLKSWLGKKIIQLDKIILGLQNMKLKDEKRYINILNLKSQMLEMLESLEGKK